MTPAAQSHLPLKDLQRWFHACITKQASGDLQLGIEQVIAGTSRQTPSARLDIYRQAYLARLASCLMEEFPALTLALGADLFLSFVHAYLQSHPPRTYTLSDLGAKLPDFLRESRPPRAAAAQLLDQPSALDAADDQAATTTGTPDADWADFLIDLATLERTYAEVFDGPGVEQGAGLDAAALAALTPEAWWEARLTPAPCLRLLRFNYPVHEYASAVRRHEPADLPVASETWLIVTRREFVVRRRAASPEEFALLQELVAGGTVGEAFGRWSQRHPLPDDTALARVRTWFEIWTALPAFAGFEE